MGLQPGACGEHVPGSQEAQRDSRRLDIGEARRNRQNVPPRNGDVLGVAAVAMLAQQAVARAEMIEAGEAARADAAGGTPDATRQGVASARSVTPAPVAATSPADLAARHERQREAMPGDAVAKPEVEMVERAGAHAHRDLTGTRNRIRPLAHSSASGPPCRATRKPFMRRSRSGPEAGKACDSARWRLRFCIPAAPPPSSWFSRSSRQSAPEPMSPGSGRWICRCSWISRGTWRRCATRRGRSIGRRR